MSLFHADDAASVSPAALQALVDLRSRGLAHRYVRHVRSSQAFALSLFALVDELAVRSVFAALGSPNVVTAEAPVFEYEDLADRLQEGSSRSQHRTQVDVLLRGTTDDGKTVAALIEVKLGETNFGECSAFASEENPDRDNCAKPGLFGEDPDRCFQLQNHGRGHRQYAAFLADTSVAPPTPRSDAGGCWLRAGRNQPMRNLALANVLVTEGEIDEAIYALCAPVGHTAIWRRFDEFRAVFSDSDEITIRALSAESVARTHADAGNEFRARYAPALRDDVLIHLSADRSALLGVWLHRDGQPMRYYGPDTEAEEDYAEDVLLGEDWESLLERLPRNSPYVAWWERDTCPVTEPIQNVYDRLTHELFAG